MYRHLPTLSLAIIAFEEVDRIARAIRSVPMATEVVVIDSGSTDGTVEAARDAGARVIQADWPGYVAQKNRALLECSGDLVLSLDADEWLSEAAQQGVEHVLAGGDPDAAGWSFPRRSRWGGRWIRHGRWYPDRRIRMLRRPQGRWIGLEPVDHLEVEGPVARIDGDILHEPYRDLGEHLATIDRYARLHAASLRAAGVRGRRRDPWIHGGWHLFRALCLERGVLDGSRGVALASLGAYHSALKWHRVRHP